MRAQAMSCSGCQFCQYRGGASLVHYLVALNRGLGVYGAMRIRQTRVTLLLWCLPSRV